MKTAPEKKIVEALLASQAALAWQVEALAAVLAQTTRELRPPPLPRRRPRRPDTRWGAK